MEEDLRELEGWLEEALAAADSVAAVERARIEVLGKKGRLTTLLKNLSHLPPAERARQGAVANTLKQTAIRLIKSRIATLQRAELGARLADKQVDVTLPGRPEPVGRIHPLSQTLDEVIAIFGWMGFTVVEGPDIEDDFHNFTALNIPPEHPARQMHDTFYLPKRANNTRFLLRTHTSPVQIRTLQAEQPPVHIIAPGRVYRRDSDTTHTPMFHQIEGLVINQSTHFGHLKGCIVAFIHAYFETTAVPVRFRPSFFPFTAPSAEVDIGCSCQEGRLEFGSGGDWLEVMGCGMVHPHVLAACGLDAERWQGFAFGIGVERIAMLKYGISDLRTFYEPDMRWLRHYGFLSLDVPTVAGKVY
ncbi:Phenylalanyl-tRNA synthetase alpha chain [invertebrate metagenome]|uniref:Phenylalanine--tRNA ligase alpha subunit n=1 Tax=invertebrate metagenome TaxID=1711999 RepID=A0A484HBP7_9ZZZZ